MSEQSNLSIDLLLDKMEQSLRRKIDASGINNPSMVGIHTGGVWIAEKLHQRLGLTEPLGVLNISFYRDDFSQIGMHPQVEPSQLPSVVEGRDIVLIDDVLYTGRTIRAALNEIFDYGRPNRVLLAVLINRNGHEVPIQADCVGENIMLRSNQRIKLVGPDPLTLIIKDFDDKHAID